MELADFMETASTYPRTITHLIAAPPSPLLPAPVYTQPSAEPTRPNSAASADLKRLLKKKNNKEETAKKKKVASESVLNQLGSQWKKPLRFESNYTASSALFPSVLAPFKWGATESTPSELQTTINRKRPTSGGPDNDLIAPASSISVGTLRKAPPSPMAAKPQRLQTSLGWSGKRHMDAKTTRAPHFGLRVLESFKSKLGSARVARGASPRVIARGAHL